MAGRDSSIENCVEFRLFPQFPDGLNTNEREQLLEELQDSYLAHLSAYLVDYIWQNEPFQLRVVPTSTGLFAALIWTVRLRRIWKIYCFEASGLIDLRTKPQGLDNQHLNSDPGNMQKM